jgi:hypothetical protein
MKGIIMTIDQICKMRDEALSSSDLSEETKTYLFGHFTELLLAARNEA